MLRVLRLLFANIWSKAAILGAATIAFWLWVHGYQASTVIDTQSVTADGFGYYWSGGAMGLAGRLKLGPLARWPLTEVGDLSETPNVSRLRLFEDGHELSPPHSLHVAIRQTGRGRFSHYITGLYFSTSDNSDPRTNGRKYVVVDRLFLSFTVASPLFAWAIAIGAGGGRRFARRHPEHIDLFYRRLGLGWVVHNVLPGVYVTIVLLAVLAGAAEIYWRAVTPFSARVWPSKFIPDVGFTFEPQAIVRHTNYTDFWTEERTNSLGFLDREPPTTPAGSGVCRVIFVGDSFVEAAQVPIKDKFHVLFEQAFNAKSADRKIQTIAIGYGGSGQIDQIPFYDRFVRPLKPDVVILVIVNNDLANNSGLLEAIRNGWDPVHSPRLFAIRDSRTGAVNFQPIDPMWRSYLVSADPSRRFGNVQSAHDFLMARSYAYRWLFTLLNRQYPRLASAISGEPVYGDRIEARMEYLRQNPQFRDLLTGWPEGTRDDIDGEFSKPDPLIPAFQDALDFSDFAFAQWAERARRDGIKLMGLATLSLARRGPKSKYFERVETLLRRNGIEEINQVSYAAKHGLRDFSFPYDGHWNQFGHRQTAEELVEYFEQHSELCT